MHVTIALDQTVYILLTTGLVRYCMSSNKTLLLELVAAFFL